MTSIKLTVTGAEAWASVNGILTSGMVGIPVTMEYDSVWNGLRKNLVCRCSPWNSDEGEYRSILNVGEAATVAHEVMQPNMYLYLGVEGYRDDGTLVIPTIWAKCGKIEYGANTCDDPTTNPELSVWNQLLAEMEQIRQDVIPPELVAEIKGYAQSATNAATNAERSKDHAVAASNEALSNAAAARYAADTAQESSDSARTSASSAANLANGALQAQRAAEAAAERAEAAADSSQNVNLAVVQTVLRNMMTIIREQVEDESGTPQAYRSDISSLAEQCDVLITGLTGSDGSDSAEKALIGISATYTGDAVPVGTAVAALTGITVTAHYSDGSAAAVSGYTLSGSIAEGSNTITVAYGGKTATITVVGVAGSTGGADDPFANAEWIKGLFVNANGATANDETRAGWYSSDYVDISGYSTVTVQTTATTWSDVKISVYTADKVCLAASGVGGYVQVGSTSYPDHLTLNIPDEAVYCRISLTKAPENFNITVEV